jgi:hypothetical protein
MLINRFNKGIALPMKSPFGSGEVWDLAAICEKIHTARRTDASTKDMYIPKLHCEFNHGKKWLRILELWTGLHTNLKKK